MQCTTEIRFFKYHSLDYALSSSATCQTPAHSEGIWLYLQPPASSI
jgi:hypothetical protein